MDTPYSTLQIQSSGNETARANILCFNPVADNVLATGLSTDAVQIWDLQQSAAKIELKLPAIIFQTAWTRNGR